jgi:hypothetical protein
MDRKENLVERSGIPMRFGIQLILSNGNKSEGHWHHGAISSEHVLVP